MKKLQLIQSGPAFTVSQTRNEILHSTMWPSALGNRGNLRFSAAEGGTPRAGRLATALYTLRHAMADLCDKLRLFFTAAPSPKRTEYKFRMQMRQYSLLLSSMLGELTAGQQTRQAQLKVAQQLAQMVNLPKDVSDQLPRRENLLSLHLGRLAPADIYALRKSWLYKSESAIADMLGKISWPDQKLRTQAEAMIKEIRKAADRQWRRPTRKLVEGCAGLLSRRLLDGAALNVFLTRLYRDEGKRLTSYLQSLSRTEFKQIQAKLNAVKLDRATRALHDSGGLLVRLRQTLEDEIYRRAEPDLKSCRVKQEEAMGRKRDISVSVPLVLLNELVSATQQAYGDIPARMKAQAQSQITAAMAYFKPTPNHDPDVTPQRAPNRFVVKNLREASSLHPLGLDPNIFASSTVKAGSGTTNSSRGSEQPLSPREERRVRIATLIQNKRI